MAINLGFSKEVTEAVNRKGFTPIDAGYHEAKVLEVFHSNARKELQFKVESEGCTGRARIDLTVKSVAQGKRLFDYLTNLGYKLDEHGNFEEQDLVGRHILIEVKTGSNPKMVHMNGQTLRVQEAYAYIDVPFNQALMIELKSVTPESEQN